MEYIKKLQDLKSKDILDTAKRVYMLLNKIYKYAVTLEYVPHDIIADIEQKIIIEKVEKSLSYFHTRKRYKRITSSY